jgi:hypothetical protein
MATPSTIVKSGHEHADHSTLEPTCLQIRWLHTWPSVSLSVIPVPAANTCGPRRRISFRVIFALHTVER